MKRSEWPKRVEACRECSNGKILVPCGLEKVSIEDCPKCGGTTFFHTRYLPVDYVTIQNVNSLQHFTVRRLAAGTQEGWIKVTNSHIYIKSKPAISYRILHEPGTVCCHCQKRLGDIDLAADIAASHVVMKHGSAPSPNPSRPLGWFRAHYYRAALEEH